LRTGLYFEFLKKAFQQKATYKVNTYLNMFGTLIQLLIQLSLWYALIGSNSDYGVSFRDMINFVIINTIVSTIIYCNIGRVLLGKISDGSIANDFIKPMNLKYYLIFDNLGKNLYDVIFGCLPVIIFSLFILDFKPPVNFTGFILFLISITNGIILINMINYILGLLGFWLHATWYLYWYLSALSRLFGGTVVPIWFYPKILADITKFLPFRFISFEPIQIYLGKLSISSSLKVIIMQLLWILILKVLENFVWNRAERKVIVFGG